jgi:DNA-3-methyladenine glycosylase
VCGPVGEAGAVLLRALAPLEGCDQMRAARQAGASPTGAAPRPIADRDLCRGPANLCKALGIDGGNDGDDLLKARSRGPRLLDDGTPPPKRPGRGPRVGIRRAAEERWRFWVAGDESVSGRPAGGRRPARPR